MTKSKLYTLYMLLFPNGYFYFGSTSKKYPSDRKGRHYVDLRKGKHVKVVQEQYDKIKQLPEFKMLKRGDEYTIKCQEYYKINENWNNPKLLNAQKPYPPHIVKILLEEGNEAALKQYYKDYNKDWYKTPLGKINYAVSGAKAYIKKFTKLKRWDMVDKWEARLEERLQHRELFKNEA